jgi:starvation-inducible DNA-binding protein
LREYPLEAGAWLVHVQAMQDALATFGRGARRSIDDATALNDADTADLFTEISRAADKSLWMVEAHIQDTSAEGERTEEPAAIREASRR